MLFEGAFADIDVVLAISEHAEDELGELACCSKDGGFAVFSASEAAVVGSEGRLGAGERYSGDTQGTGDAIGAGTVAAFVELFAARDRAPGGQM